VTSDVLHEGEDRPTLDDVGLLLSRVRREAFLLGADRVRSVVHWDNKDMIELNKSMGASVLQDPEHPMYCLCILPTSPF
jgi:hypothetical protein